MSISKNNRTGRRSLRNMLIYPEFQVKFILWMLACVSIVIIFISVLSFIWFKKMQAQGFQMNLPDTHPYFALLNNFAESYLTILAGSLILTVLLCLSMGFILSHRIAGPLVKLRNHFNRMSDLKNERHSVNISFRKKDFFRDLAEAYNKTITKNESIKD